MAQACTVAHTENKRSLPAWMLKACSVNEVAKTEDQNKQALESNVQIGVLGQTNPVQRKTGRRLKSVRSENASELVGVLQPCGGRERVKRKSKDAVRDEFEEIEELTNNNARKVTGRAPPKNSKKRKLETVKSEGASSGTIDDEIELTIDDLVNIAEEYVNADKRKQQELETVMTDRQKEHLPCPTMSSEADTGVSVVNVRSVKGLMRCTTFTTNTRPSEYSGAQNKSHQELQYPSSVETTGDAAQHMQNKNHQELQCSSSVETTGDVAKEMLNLIFGHLLKKPAGYTKDSRPIESITTASHVPEKTGVHSKVPSQGEPVKKSMPIESTATNRVPEKKDWRSELVRNGEQVVKKKSSLKDLFL